MGVARREPTLCARYAQVIVLRELTIVYIHIRMEFIN